MGNKIDFTFIEESVIPYALLLCRYMYKKNCLYIVTFKSESNKNWKCRSVDIRRVDKNEKNCKKYFNCKLSIIRVEKGTERERERGTYKH